MNKSSTIAIDSNNTSVLNKENNYTEMLSGRNQSHGGVFCKKSNANTMNIEEIRINKTILEEIRKQKKENISSCD